MDKMYVVVSGAETFQARRTVKVFCFFSLPSCHEEGSVALVSSQEDIVHGAVFL